MSPLSHLSSHTPKHTDNTPDLLERAGIVWPNPRITTNSSSASSYFGHRAKTINLPVNTKHKKVVSVSDVNAAPFMSSFPGPPPASARDVFQQATNGHHEGSSRSTSAYSTFSDSAAPLMQNNPSVPAYPGTHEDVTRKNQQFAFRLPSDQLQMIINSISPSPTQQQHSFDPAATMPPPPLPAHAMAAKDTSIGDQCAVPLEAVTDPLFGQDFGSTFVDRRAESRYSDISMHAGCTSFPTCTSEDAEGRIVHDSPGAPAAVVKGKKEGSSPTKRKLSSDSTNKNDHAEKRTRRSARLLQHDSGYGDSSSDDRANGNAGEEDVWASVQ